jgi:flagellar export protein FliJ
MAKKFVFRLETLHKLRTHKANQAKEALNQVVFLRVKKENEIDNQKNYQSELNRTNPESSKVINMQAMLFHRSFISEDISRLENEKKQIVEIETLKRRELSEAQKQEKIIDKLKEKKIGAYKETLLKEESKNLDEIGLNIYYKNH